MPARCAQPLRAPSPIPQTAHVTATPPRNSPALASPLAWPATNVLPVRRSLPPLLAGPVSAPPPRSAPALPPSASAALHTATGSPTPVLAAAAGLLSRLPSTATHPIPPTAPVSCIPAPALSGAPATPSHSAFPLLLPPRHTPPAAPLPHLPVPPPPPASLLRNSPALLPLPQARSGNHVSSPAGPLVPDTPGSRPLGTALGLPSHTSAVP